LLQAISINPVDYKILKGAFPNTAGPGETGWGSDVAGIVAAVGAEVTTLKVGDEVYSDAILHSPFATAVRIPAHKASKKPANLSFAEAATVPLAGQTALQALRDHGRMQPGFRVCVFGGSGGVGAFALQIAKALGASHVACTSSNKEMCERLGADQVVNYREADVGEVLAGGDFDIVFDTVRACERSGRERSVFRVWGASEAGASEAGASEAGASEAGASETGASEASIKKMPVCSGSGP
jgi:NADPH:quinone reductase-like Zn-dependent oxidoreductase